MRDIKEFEDIINLPHRQSPDRPKMSNYDRAAQFMPFAALKGYDDEIEEAGRLTGERLELDEDTMSALNDTVRRLQERIQERPRIKVTYFKPDARKEGGEYVQYEGELRRILEVERQLVFVGNKVVKIDDIFGIEIN